MPVYEYRCQECDKRFEALRPMSQIDVRCELEGRATIEGRGPGAIRRCQFTTGDFVEPIEVWNEPSLLRFRVTQNPPVMRETNPFGEVDAPHLRGFFESRRGQFQLLPLLGNRTLLIGTTWYTHRIEPQFYWRLWSDRIIHAIHARVLTHIKSLSEGAWAAGRR